MVTICLLLGSVAYGQTLLPNALPAGVHGQAWVIKSRFSLFPDTGRANGHTYRGVFYPAEKHYRDSSVLVFVPDYFNKNQYYDFVFWFHGWYNHIDSAAKRFQLLEQFYKARRNAIFVFPQGPFNAPDSYGGKLEQPEGYLKLWSDVVNQLFQKELVSKEGFHPVSAGVVLAGHSGAYRVIAKCLQQAPMLFQNATVLLFDGLYGEMDTYLAFCRQTGTRFVHIYTNDGGTQKNSLDFMKNLDSLGIGYMHREEAEVIAAELEQKRIVFLHSQLGHNDVIVNLHNFQRLLTVAKRP